MRLPRLALYTSFSMISKDPDFPPWSANSTLYHVYSIWLFTFSDFKTIIAPSTAFSILHKLASPSFGVEHDPETTTLRLVTQTATVAGWAWINLLPFAIDNQPQVNSIEEDRHNKPWRPLWEFYKCRTITMDLSVGSHSKVSLITRSFCHYYNNSKKTTDSSPCRLFLEV